MKPIETYKRLDCGNEWGVSYATWEVPPCEECGDHLSVTETTDEGGLMVKKLAKYYETNWGSLDMEIARERKRNNKIEVALIKGYIDIALDNRDEALFMELTTKLKGYEV